MQKLALAAPRERVCRDLLVYDKGAFFNAHRGNRVDTETADAAMLPAKAFAARR
jgi:hypothetical protein